jgi:hypothetical protein
MTDAELALISLAALIAGVTIGLWVICALEATMSDETFPVEGEIMRRRARIRPSPWVADMIAAAYSEDAEAIREIAGHMSAEEARQLHHALRVMIGALVGERLTARNRKRMSLSVQPERGTPDNPVRLGGDDA